MKPGKIVQQKAKEVVLNEINDPFIHVLKAISFRVQDELCVSFPKKAKLINNCKSCSDKMQAYYYHWESNMNMAMDSVKKMSSFKDLVSYNSEIQTAITAFNETINKGRENMGEAKKIWSGKCKKIYRDLDIKNHGNERVLENIEGSVQLMSAGLREISSLAKENYNKTKKACMTVFTEYNTAIKSVPEKTRKKMLYKKIIATPGTLGGYIGKLTIH